MAAWADMEAALVAWLTESLGEGASVRWENQPGPQESPALVSVLGRLRVLALVPEEGTPVVRHAQDVSRPPSLRRETRHTTRAALTVRATVSTDGRTTGPGCAMDRLSRAVVRLTLPGVAGALGLVGLGVEGRGAVQDVTALIGNQYQGRATVDLRLAVRLTASELGAFVESVRLTSTVH